MAIGRTRYFGLAAIAASVAALAGAQTPPAPDGVKVIVTVNNVVNAAGTIRGMLCPDRQVFPNTACLAAFYATAPAIAGAVELTFTGVKPGTYGLAISHDEDNDGRLNVFSEPFAFGNGATALPPTFEGAKLNITGDLKTMTALFKMEP